MEEGSPSFGNEEDQEEVADYEYAFNSERDEEDQEVANNIYNYYDPTLEEEQIQVLVQREINFGFNKNQSSHTEILLSMVNKDARLEALTWILTTSPVLGFHSRTAYLSMTYIDRLFSRRSPNVEHRHQQTRLISVACLSLAAKMEEASKLPPLGEFEVEDYIFPSTWVEDAELSVLETLEWNMNLITPLAFLDYFIRRWCSNPPLPDDKSRITGFFMSIIGEINLMHHRPSSIAAAATLMALNRKLRREDIKSGIKSNPSFHFLDIEDVCTCYYIMEEQELKKANYYDPKLEAEHIEDLIEGDTRYEVLKHARLEAMEWILIRAPFLRLQSKTAYLSMTYLDRCLSKRTPNKKNCASTITLIAVACLSLAVKMEERKKMPLFPKFASFPSRAIQSTELRVLETLEFKVDLVTPFAFLEYFIRRLCNDPPAPDVKSRIEGFVMSIISELNLNHHRPSSIAAAATLMALDQELTTEGIKLMIKSNPSFDFLEIEGVFLCYNIMKQKELKKLKLEESQSEKPPDLLPQPN